MIFLENKEEKKEGEETVKEGEEKKDEEKKTRSRSPRSRSHKKDQVLSLEKIKVSSLKHYIYQTIRSVFCDKKLMLFFSINKQTLVVAAQNL